VPKNSGAALGKNTTSVAKNVGAGAMLKKPNRKSHLSPHPRPQTLPPRLRSPPIRIPSIPVRFLVVYSFLDPLLLRCIPCWF